MLSATTATSSPVKRVRKRRNTPGIKSALPFLAPALILYAVFVVLPTFESVRLSFYEWNGFAGSPQEFVGFKNYVKVFTQDPVFWTALKNTIIWVVLSLLIPMTLSLVLAVALNRRMPGRDIFRSGFYIPSVLASIAVANIWRWMYNPNYGISASLGENLNIPWLGEIQWLGDKNLALYAIFLAFIWQSVGLNMVLFLAGLQAVGREHIEAARIDGANGWQVFRHVTLPALKPTLLVVTVLTFIGSIKVFDLIVGMTGGGPAQQTQVLALWSYQQSLINHEYGLGNTIATVLLLITLVVIVPYMSWMLREED